MAEASVRTTVRGLRCQSLREPPARDRTAGTVSARPHGLGASSAPAQRDRPLGGIHLSARAAIDDGPVALSVTQDGTPEAPRLSARLGARPIDPAPSGSCSGALNRLLGLDVDLSAFAAMAASDPLLGPLAARMRGLKPPRFPTVFEALVNGVACQQLSLDVGIHLLNRLTAERGRPVSGTRRACAGSRAPRSSRPPSQRRSSASASATPRPHDRRGRSSDRRG